MFTTEQQLVNTLKQNYSSICGWDTSKCKTKILEEVNLGFGIADLVITKMKGTKTAQSSYLNYFDAIIYKIIKSSKEVSFEKLQDITKADTTTINRSLNKLVKDSYINKTDSLIKFKTTYRGLESDSIAIEAKLKNWKRALNQAFRYKWFAKRTLVVLDSRYVKPALANIAMFKKMNVGLAEINKCGIIKLHFNPIKSTPIDYSMWILLNEELRKSLSCQKK